METRDGEADAYRVGVVILHRSSAVVSGSQHLPEGASPPQGDIHTSPAMDRYSRCAEVSGSTWLGGGDRRHSG